MKPIIKTKGSEEVEAFSRKWRKRVFWQTGELKRVKQGYNRRLRRIGKREVYGQY